MSQIQETRAANSEMTAEHKRALREEQDARRKIESELASARAHREAAERRRGSLEEELGRSRQMLAQSKNSSVEIARMNAELSVLRDKKDKLESEARTMRTDLAAARKAEQDAKRGADMQLTKLRMQYERQISVLESRLLE